MFKFIVLSVLISLSVCYSEDSFIDDTELLLTFLVHRHGDRTPVESLMTLSDNEDALILASAKYGYGQLTDVGKRRGYQLGQFIRRRYDSFLSPQYNRSEIYIRSTDSTRSKMTVLSAMAAVYPTGQDNWSSSINWTPVPYTTVPAEYDFNLASLNCPTFLSAYGTLLLSTSPSMDNYTDVLNQWSEIVGFNITAVPAFAYMYFDLYAAQKSLGVALEPELEELYPEMEEVAGAAMDIVFGNEEYVDLLAGVLLNEFFTVADQIIAGEDVARVQVYSAHDINVYAFESVTKISPRQGVPKFASAYALELRKVVATGEYVVLPVYLNTPSEDVITYLQVEGCDQLCNIESFREITSTNVLDEDAWRTKCQFTEDYDFDFSSIE